MYPTFPATTVDLCAHLGPPEQVLPPGQATLRAVFLRSTCSHGPYGDALHFTIGQMDLDLFGSRVCPNLLSVN